MAANADIIVALDLGTTFTEFKRAGVAWMTPKRPPHVINDWPGSGDRGERKVPTTLVYNSDGSISSWGFLCEDDDDDDAGSSKTRREFFKIFLDQDTLTAAQRQGISSVPSSTNEAQRFIIDYLKEIYSHVKEIIETQIGKRSLGGWGQLNVVFLFSVPTTWTSMAIINTFKGIIKSAGFGTEGPNHTAQVDLTEAEAASIATLKMSPLEFQKGSLFLTVDAGGGTTDLALMRVTSTEASYPEISQVASVTGIGIGSTLIDRAFVRLVTERLEAYPEVRRVLPTYNIIVSSRSSQLKAYATKMSRSPLFINAIKHKFGEKSWTWDNFRFKMDGVSHEFSHPGLRIENGRMLFSKTREEIQQLFDSQIEGMIKKIREQLDWITQSGMREQLAYMILAGGLGSSVYVRRKIQEYLMSCNHPNANQVVVIPCQEPQLVVIRGLLLDQQQKLETGSHVLKTRIARASYGVLVKVPYSAALHASEDTEVDRFDRDRTWALRQIHWLIRKGDAIDSDAVLTKGFEFWLGPGETTRTWDATFLISHNEASQLPKSLKQPGASNLCSVESNLSGVKQHELVMKHKRGTCLRRGKTYYICNFDIRVIVAPADIRFELWFGGRKWSGNHEPILVTWD
ncbi:unnamed protein product [Clonostachys rosea f. rosea IK726]|uniref:Uncharacterized protein n=1 Tax=Clonostachys rosea f. rosea IK726 TaxID=1349383 RepID=A0ACA9UFF4_BIOOC|nr:unnamed protein product [Clonostachys rosea f. rosea IK726]